MMVKYEMVPIKCYLSGLSFLVQWVPIPSTIFVVWENGCVSSKKSEEFSFFPFEKTTSSLGLPQASHESKAGKNVKLAIRAYVTMGSEQ